MKHINFATFIAGLFIAVLVGMVTIFIFGNSTFSGLCMVTAAILYNGALEPGNDSNNKR